jgi:hypothetical protein
MIRLGDLRNIATGLAGSFVSRNNDSGGYWALGKLRSLAEQARVDKVRIPLRPMGRCDNPLLTEIASSYAAHLARLIERAGGAMDSVAEASVVVHFATSWPAGVPRQGTQGDPVACDVHIVDKMGRQVAARRVTFCRPHDPTLEFRSARSRDT